MRDDDLPGRGRPASPAAAPPHAVAWLRHGVRAVSASAGELPRRDREAHAAGGRAGCDDDAPLAHRGGHARNPGASRQDEEGGIAKRAPLTRAEDGVKLSSAAPLALSKQGQLQKISAKIAELEKELSEGVDQGDQAAGPSVAPAATPQEGEEKASGDDELAGGSTAAALEG